MYKYIHDPKTGGLLLTDETTSSPLSSKEPRPVYSSELDILGINKYWKYAKQDDVPYMWAEKNVYIYRGKSIFTVTGGSLYERPVVKPCYVLDKDGNATSELVLPQGKRLRKIDLNAMIEKNRMMIDIVEQKTLKRVYDYYFEMEKKVDCFHVAFSGGKDSIVLLELIKRALPQRSFIVIFGDTKMEFPDTYELVDKIESQCQKDGIVFYRAQSHLDPDESWQLFGPPSRHIRWCCYVHKSTPQTLKLREVLKKENFVGVDFVGIRSFESAARADYEIENYGAKQKGQYSHNSILDWTSAEVWLYTYYRKLLINSAYKKGIARVGCLFCPMGSGKSDSFRYLNYQKEIDHFINIIKNAISDENIESYISNGGWSARRNGRDLKDNERIYQESIEPDGLEIRIKNSNISWKEWIKTIGVQNFSYVVSELPDGFRVKAPASIDKTTEGRLFKQVFRKATYCIGCRVCETNCRHNAISFKDGKVNITNCIHCLVCHKIDDGCLVYFSVKLPNQKKETEGRKVSLNTLSDHAPKPEWLRGFFTQGKEFFNSNSLGPVQVTKYKRFLSDANLIEKGETTHFFDIITKIGWQDINAWALILIQLVNNNPQIRWYADNIAIGVNTDRSFVKQLLQNEEVSPKDSDSIIKAFGRLADTQLGTELRFAMIAKEKSSIVSLSRGKTPSLDPKVILYSLYKYAEACGGYYQFTLRYLTDPNSQSAGVSPSKLFGLTSDELEPTLRGLSILYSDFISTAFTHDLDKITLNSEVKSDQILELF